MRREVLHLVRDRVGRYEVVCNDGTITTVEDGAAPPENAGILLPPGVWAAICEIAVPSHGAAEVKRLEDALAVERARVDRVLDAGLR